MDLSQYTGKRLLFLGVNTEKWTLAQFQQAAQFARTHKVDSLLIKVADGGNRWYGSLAGWQNIKQTIKREGVGAIPYTYSYGNTYGALKTEADLLIEYMHDCGIVVMDAEAEWNGHADWAQYLESRMRPEPGIFLVSTWANPYDQAWQGVIQALNPCVNAYMPQQYTNYLAGCWGQFGALGAKLIQPTVMMTGDFGPNDPVAIARAAHNQGHTAISIWYYDLALANPALLDQILAVFPASSTAPAPTPVPTPTPTQGGNTHMSIPANWKDDGKTLTAPNGIQVVQGFRDYVLSHNWDTANLPLETAQGLTPLELSNPGLGGGTRQTFRWTVLEWTSKQGVFEAWSGQELLATLNLLHTTQSKLVALQKSWDSVVAEKNGLVGEKAALQKQVADLNAQIAQLKAQLATSNVGQLQQQIVTLTQQVQALSTKLTQIVTIAKA